VGAFALHTGADVYGGDMIQWCSKYAGLANGRFEFKAREGQL
jgi:hypothetical protein